MPTSQYQSGSPESRTLFFSSVSNIDTGFITNSVCQHPNAEIALAITNGAQPETENKLIELGFEHVSTEYKNQHPSQRELDSYYLKLWVLDLKDFQKNARKKVGERIKRYSKLPEYSFLTMSLKEAREKIPRDFSYSKFRDRAIKNGLRFPGDSCLPIPKYITQDEIEKAKKFIIKEIGFLPPNYNPFTENKISSIYEIISLQRSLIAGDHLNVD
jgi:hypothetical protein